MNGSLIHPDVGSNTELTPQKEPRKVSDRNQLVALMGLISLGLTCIVGAVILAGQGQPVPEPLVALGGVCVGAMGTYAALRAPNGRN